MTSTTAMGPNSPYFNFVQYLLDCNAQRPEKLAFVDDLGSLSYGALADRIRAVAGALVGCGVHREERVLLLMHDCNDWPTTFLGAMYAGIVPVAVNTLLTVDDYAYMLQKSRSQVALVSQALLPVLQQAMAQAEASGGHEVKLIVVSVPQGPLPAGVLALDDFLAAHAPLPATPHRFRHC
jgi:benzoate-CoA ligase